MGDLVKILKTNTESLNISTLQKRFYCTQTRVITVCMSPWWHTTVLTSKINTSRPVKKPFQIQSFHKLQPLPEKKIIH